MTTVGRWLVIAMACWEAASVIAAPAEMARAANIQISTTRLMLSADKPVTSITVRNVSDTEVGVQAELVDWSQNGSGDVYHQTDDIVVNPAIFKIPGNGQQVVRFGLEAAGSTGSERCYRLFIQELPSAQAQAGVVQTLLRFSVPVFVPVAARPPDLRWQVVAGAHASVILSNQGTSHIQITNLVLHAGSGGKAIEHRLSSYVLPGHTQTLPVTLPPLKAGQRVTIDADTDSDTATATQGKLPPITVEVSDAGSVQQ